MYHRKVVSCLLQTNIKAIASLYLPLNSYDETALYFHLVRRAGSQKSKPGFELLLKLYYMKLK